MWWAHFVDRGRRGRAGGEKCAWEAYFSPRRYPTAASWDEMRPDTAVLAAGRRRHGIVTSRELAHLGLSAKAIEHRVRVGWLTRIHRGIYLVGPLEVPLSRPTAAVLALGAGAALSHASAAWLWELTAAGDDIVHVVIANRDARSRRGLRVHRVRDLDPRDVVRRQGVAITTPPRTLLDLGTTLAPRELARA